MTLPADTLIHRVSAFAIGVPFLPLIFVVILFLAYIWYTLSYIPVSRVALFHPLPAPVADRCPATVREEHGQIDLLQVHVKYILQNLDYYMAEQVPSHSTSLEDGLEETDGRILSMCQVAVERWAQAPHRTPKMTLLMQCNGFNQCLRSFSQPGRKLILISLLCWHACAGRQSCHR